MTNPIPMISSSQFPLDERDKRKKRSAEKQQTLHGIVCPEMAARKQISTKPHCESECL